MTPEEEAQIANCWTRRTGRVRECPYAPGTIEASKYYDELRRLKLVDYDGLCPTCPGNKR